MAPNDSLSALASRLHWDQLRQNYMSPLSAAGRRYSPATLQGMNYVDITAELDLIVFVLSACIFVSMFHIVFKFVRQLVLHQLQRFQTYKKGFRLIGNISNHVESF